jgi:hypothetical protein
METRMNRPILVCALFAIATAALGAQEASQSTSYQGTSAPPSDDEIITSSEPQAKPPAGRLASSTPARTQVVPRSSSEDSSVNNSNYGNDDGLVEAAQPAPVRKEPALTERPANYDPDGDIVHPRALHPNELAEGTTIRVRLLDRLSTATNEKDEAFRTRVASDVLQDDKVLIPAGAEIDGRVVDVSSGHFGGHGTMRLRPETVILADGTHYRLHAEIIGTPGSKARIGSEGTINPGSRVKRDSIEYGGAVGVGATTGAIMAGPAGALAGSLIGAGAVTAHLLISHPQATLETGTVIIFTLTEPLDMVPARNSEN